MDRDAKVSGLITFTGQAEDNVMVKKLAVTIDGYNLKNNVAEEFVIAYGTAENAVSITSPATELVTDDDHLTIEWSSGLYC